jgi:hypothetical protein
VSVFCRLEGDGSITSLGEDEVLLELEEELVVVGGRAAGASGRAAGASGRAAGASDRAAGASGRAAGASGRAAGASGRAAGASSVEVSGSKVPGGGSSTEAPTFRIASSPVVICAQVLGIDTAIFARRTNSACSFPYIVCSLCVTIWFATG